MFCGEGVLARAKNANAGQGSARSKGLAIRDTAPLRLGPQLGLDVVLEHLGQACEGQDRLRDIRTVGERGSCARERGSARSTHPRHTDEDAALERRLAHERGLRHGLGQAAARRRVVGVGARRKLVEVADARGHVRGQERAHLAAAKQVPRRAESVGPRSCIKFGIVVLTVNVSHPVSTFLFLASSNVDRRTALSLDTGGAGGSPGFRSVSRCLMAGGNVLTTIVAR